MINYAQSEVLITGYLKADPSFLIGIQDETKIKPMGRMKIGANQVDTYYFDTEQSKRYPFKEGCSKSKTYSVSIKSGEHVEQMAFQETKYFKEKV